MKVVVVGGHAAYKEALLEALAQTEHEVVEEFPLHVRDEMPDPTADWEPARPIQDWQQPGRRKMRRQR